MDKTVKKYIFLITYTMLLYFALRNVSPIWGAFARVIAVFMPFICGFVIAYIVNWPVEFFASTVFKVNEKDTKNRHKIKKTLAVLLSYLLVFGVIIFLAVIVAPQLASSFTQLLANSSGYFERAETMVRTFLERFRVSDAIYTQVESTFDKVAREFHVEDYVFRALGFMKRFALGAYNLSIGVIVSIYLIFNKEMLTNQLHKLSKAILPEKVFANTLETLSLAHNVFGKFIVGKVLNSLILGGLCFIGVALLRAPYALLISVIIAVTNLVPFFGPIVGAVVCIFLLLMINPVKALWFAIFIIILQQIDANIIGPKILGSSVGISGVFIMFSVIIGGGLFGVPGMVLGVPVFVVLYTVVARFVRRRLGSLAKE